MCDRNATTSSLSTKKLSHEIPCITTGDNHLFQNDKVMDYLGTMVEFGAILLTTSARNSLPKDIIKSEFLTKQQR